MVDKRSDSSRLVSFSRNITLSFFNFRQISNYGESRNARFVENASINRVLTSGAKAAGVGGVGIKQQPNESSARVTCLQPSIYFRPYLTRNKRTVNPVAYARSKKTKKVRRVQSSNKSTIWHQTVPPFAGTAGQGCMGSLKSSRTTSMMGRKPKVRSGFLNTVTR